MTIDEILDEIENMLVDSTRVPFTNKLVIEEDDLIRLLDELREVMPQEIKDAAKIVSERQRILEEAQKEAQNIVDQAKVYGTKLTDENIISKQAQEQANEIVLQARKAARDLQNDAITYADDVFTHLENNLKKALEVVQQGHNNLQQNKQNQ
ncbi:ATPase [Dendrosporobacter sp. 1207_IL3150]|uniref:ATPase n=1 Tax=Dendrosporobacter sp. 1207_IL3150 TaxID=3084054 RepID=UPI002FD967B6